MTKKVILLSDLFNHGIKSFTSIGLMSAKYSRGDRDIMGHGELRTSVIFSKTVSNYCPKTFFF